ncbi:MAG TPA: hypothetical protein PKC18_13630, partial [Lacipirellulaceae bacterium]|nr:hypothetical protein [Lacipirellulaceae bacterium]
PGTEDSSGNAHLDSAEIEKLAMKRRAMREPPSPPLADKAPGPRVQGNLQRTVDQDAAAAGAGARRAGGVRFRTGQPSDAGG